MNILTAVMARNKENRSRRIRGFIAWATRLPIGAEHMVIRDIAKNPKTLTYPSEAIGRSGMFQPPATNPIVAGTAITKPNPAEVATAL